MTRDPNKAFKHRKHPYASPRPYQKALVIRCDREGCGFKMKISRSRWLDKDYAIKCPRCMRTDFWTPL